MGSQILIFTPTFGDLLRHETVSSIVAQQTTHRIVWEVSRCNPYPHPEGSRDLRNVLAQYERGRELFLSGPYDAMLTVEHDMVLPPHAVQTLYSTPAPVVYAVYMLRHGTPVLNAWQYIGPQGLGMSLEFYPDELRRAWAAGVGRVSGCGFGCTLMRRDVIEAIPFRTSLREGQAPDMPFAIDCVQQDVLQLARFDVRCGHIHEGGILEMESSEPEVQETVPSPEGAQTAPAPAVAPQAVKVTILQAVNVASGALTEGQEVELSATEAQMLLDVGYAKLSGREGSPGGFAGAETKPKVPRR